MPAAIHAVTPETLPIARDLLLQFFAEEGFAGDREKIGRNLALMLEDGNCWAALAEQDGTAIGVVTVSATRDIEYGRLAEIGDLYVQPAGRGRGVAGALIAAAKEWCRSIGCQAVLVTVTAEGAAEHDLLAYYTKLGFGETGRTVAECQLG